MNFYAYLMRPVYVVHVFTHQLYTSEVQATTFIRSRLKYRDDEIIWHRRTLAHRLKELRKAGLTREQVRKPAADSLAALKKREQDDEAAFARRGGMVIHL